MKKNAFFLFLTDKHTYLSLVYIIFAFIMSTIYFTVFITGLSLSLGLLVIFIGIFSLIATLYLAVGISKFEVVVAREMLGIKEKEKDGIQIIPAGKPFYYILLSGYAWKRLAYFILKFPFDVVIFSFSISLFGLSFQFLFAPLLIEQFWYRDHFFEFMVLTLGDPYALSFLGLILLPFSLFLINNIGRLYAMIIKNILMR